MEIVKRGKERRGKERERKEEKERERERKQTKCKRECSSSVIGLVLFNLRLEK